MVCMFCKSPSLIASISTPLFNDVDAVILDCDGVLVDTEHLKFLAWQQALATLNIEFSIEEYKSVAGHSSKKIVEMLEQTKGMPISEKAIFLRRYEYQKLQERGINPIKETPYSTLNCFTRRDEFQRNCCYNQTNSKYSAK